VEEGVGVHMCNCGVPTCRLCSVSMFLVAAVERTLADVKIQV
jgi:hypothetical protein